MSRKWIYPKADISKLRNDPRLTGISELMLRILVNRGLTSADQIISFLYSSKHDLLNTAEMMDASKAVSIIQDSLKNNEEIVVYGDFDADGCSATVVMVSLLRRLGAKVGFYTNNRFLHGYGMCKEGIDEMLSLYPNTRLIITVDNGIMAFGGIDYAKSLGIKVVVTDHHEQGEVLPNADAVVNPKRHDCKYPFKGLCGAGVAFKLMMLLYWTLGEKLQPVYDMLDIVALATVGDVVPLLGENRIIVKEGLKLISEEKRPAFRIFREATGVTEINSHFTLGFIYVPTINAIGRINGDPRKAIEIFLTDDERSITENLNYLIELNKKRKDLTEKQYEEAENLLSQKGVQEGIVLYGDSFHEGIIGLIAGRIKEKYNRPTIVLTKSENALKGSARSIDGFNIKEGLDALSYLFLKHGGHAKAAGLSLDESNLANFEKAFIELCKKSISKDDFVKKYVIDCVISPDTVSTNIVDELRQLEPYGEGFPKPLLALNNFKFEKPFYMGTEKQHVKFDNGRMSVIVWRGSETYKNRGEPKNIRALGYPSLNVFKNNVTLQFIVDGDNFADMNMVNKTDPQTPA